MSRLIYYRRCTITVKRTSLGFTSEVYDATKPVSVNWCATLDAAIAYARDRVDIYRDAQEEPAT